MMNCIYEGLCAFYSRNCAVNHYDCIYYQKRLRQEKIELSKLEKKIEEKEK